MADGTFVPDGAPRSTRVTQRFGTIVIVGGGCYGGYYARQLGRAAHAGAVTWRRLIVVDHDPRCPVHQLSASDRPPRLECVQQDWREFFAAYLGAASDRGLQRPASSGDAFASLSSSASDDAIVPSPLMPHLMADWLGDRARERWPGRSVTTASLASAPDVPWQRAGDDGTHYVSFAEWMCPINCIEPERCPHTRGPRTWSMPPAVRSYVERERAEGRVLEGPHVFHCLHRAYGVGMIDVRDVLAADAAIAALGRHGETSVLVGTVSHCHGALRRIVLGA